MDTCSCQRIWYKGYTDLQKWWEKMSGWLNLLKNPKTAGKVKELLESTIKKVNPKLGFEDTKAYKQKLKMKKFFKKDK